MPKNLEFPFEREKNNNPIKHFICTFVLFSFTNTMKMLYFYFWNKNVQHVFHFVIRHDTQLSTTFCWFFFFQFFLYCIMLCMLLWYNLILFWLVFLLLICLFHLFFFKDGIYHTPPRTPRISRLKSQIMKPTFLS